MKLNLGCGSQTPEGWVNVDYALGARLLRLPILSAVNRRIKLFNTNWDDTIVIHDLRKRFPWGDGVADVIYSSHTLEHLTREEGRYFLQECWRVLRPKGVIRIIVPNLETIVSSYARGEILADEFIHKLEVMYDTGNGGILRKALAPFISVPHKCMYDTKRLMEIMREIGFRVESKQPFKSTVENIRSIELEDRATGAVIVEGTKA
jgi:predicted SAM-dependent methyltransferase